MLVGLTATAAWSTKTPFVLATAISLVFLGLAAVVDVRERRLPNALVGAALVPVAVAALAPAVSGSTDMVTGALAGAAVLGGPLLLTHLVSPAGMGFGDVKAGAVLGAALGLIDVQVAVLALLLALAGSAAWAVVRRQRTMPLGPGLVLGAVAALAIAWVVGVEASSW